MFCPKESYNSIKLQNEDADVTFYGVGEEVSFECGPAGREYIERYEEYTEEFFVYPTATRKCLPDGTWSGVPPICAWDSKIAGHAGIVYR